jgi:hypothetical protein
VRLTPLRRGRPRQVREIMTARADGENPLREGFTRS